MLYYIMFLHWFGDFVAQNRYMADNKNRSIWALLLHGFIYMVCLYFGVLLYACIQYSIAADLCTAFLYALANTGLHVLVDGVTSKITHSLYSSGDYYNFFVVVGFDQLLHILGLLVTYGWLIAPYI